MTKVKVYTANEQTIAVRILLLAFSSDPWKRYLMPNPSTYIKNSTLWFENAVRQSIESKTLFGTDDKSGIATWFKPNYELEFEEIEETFKELPRDHEKETQAKKGHLLPQSVRGFWGQADPREGKAKGDREAFCACCSVGAKEDTTGTAYR